jgi:hypothetical protein
MLHFSWKKVFYHAKGKPKEILQIIRMLTFKDLPLNKRDRIYKYSHINFSGTSFLVHPEVMLCNESYHSQRDLAIYISLASLRPYADYLAHNVLTLDLLHAPGEPVEYIKDPRLLSIEDGKIHFLYEEVTNQTKH